jgi:hypothetical protein
MQQRFLLQILLLAQHVSGTTMPIIRSSRVLYSVQFPIIYLLLCHTAKEESYKTVTVSFFLIIQT